MLGPQDLVLCAGSLPQGSFRERVEAVSKAGFSGISLYPSDVEKARQDGLTDSDLARLLADAGLQVAELDPLLSWGPSLDASAGVTKEGARFLGFGEREFYALAEVVHARSINAVWMGTDVVAPERLAESFAALCDRARDHGLLVHLEFLPWTRIPDALEAFEIVRLANRDNGGLMLDTWHQFRSGCAASRLREIPGERILGFQINDAPREAAPNVVHETLHARRLPGDGDIDLHEILDILADGASPAPIGIEVFSDEIAALPVETAARRLADSVRAVLASRSS